MLRHIEQDGTRWTPPPPLPVPRNGPSPLTLRQRAAVRLGRWPVTPPAGRQPLPAESTVLKLCPPTRSAPCTKRRTAPTRPRRRRTMAAGAPGPRRRPLPGPGPGELLLAGQPRQSRRDDPLVAMHRPTADVRRRAGQQHGRRTPRNLHRRALDPDPKETSATRSPCSCHRTRHLPVGSRPQDRVRPAAVRLQPRSRRPPTAEQLTNWHR